MGALLQIEGEAPAERLKCLDGWRGMAILCVLVGHFAVFAPPGLAPAGVDLFFVLSGRLMAELLIVRRVPLGEFLVRRASRILPALAAFVLLMLAALLAAPGYASASRSLLGASAAMFFFQNYLAAEHVLPFFEHCWSLAVEEHSYLLLAGVALVAGRSRPAAAGAALLLAAAAMANGYAMNWHDFGDGLYPYTRSDVRAASILLSFALWVLIQPRLPHLQSRAITWLAPGFLTAGLALHLVGGVPDRLCFTLGTFCFAIAVVTIDRAHPRLLALLGSPLLTWLGLVSFSLYLWQQPLFVATRSGAPILACLPIAFGCAWWSFHAIEGPARAGLNRAYGRFRARPRLPAAESRPA